MVETFAASEPVVVQPLGLAVLYACRVLRRTFRPGLTLLVRSFAIDLHIGGASRRKIALEGKQTASANEHGEEACLLSSPR